MKVILGDKFITAAFGIVILCPEGFLDVAKLCKGETVLYNDEKYIVQGLIPPSAKVNRWSIRVKEVDAK